MSRYKKEKTLKKVFGSFQKTDFDSFNHFIHSAYANWFLFLILLAFLSLTLTFYIDHLPSDVKIGKKAPRDIKAERTYNIEDEKATERSREEAVKSVLPVFDFQDQVLDEIQKRIHGGFSALRAKLVEEPNLSFAEVEEIIPQKIGLKLSSEESKYLFKNEFSTKVEDALDMILSKKMNNYIVSDRDVLIGLEGENILLRYPKLDAIANETVVEERVIRDLNLIYFANEVKEDLEKAKLKDLIGAAGSGLNDKILLAIASRLLRPNVVYDPQESELRKLQAKNKVRPVMITIDAGEYIIRSGEPYNVRHLLILNGIQKQKSQSSISLKVVGTVLFISMLLLITYAFSIRYIRKFNPSRNDLIFMGGTLLITLVSVRFSAGMSFAFKEVLPFDVPIQAFYYAIPIAFGPMLVRMLINAESSLVFAICSTTLAGLFLASDLGLPVYFLISSIAGASSIAHADKRSAIVKAGLYCGLINAFTIVSIKIIHFASATEAFGTMDLLATVVFGFMGGIFSSMLVTIFSPIAEVLFDYTSDMTLLELGNSNHPLLQEMILKAPGTYHHSQLVAILSESAAREIGANPLLCRVGGYFHDIGKMKKALYFIENQQGGENRHDKLSPSMSALIITSHVKDGLDMARQFKLPKKIAAFIPEHQGTKLIKYFYNKAKEMEDPDIQTIDSNDYRYPGPRPQTRESGIMLLADGVEAAVRSMQDKSPAKIRAMVQKIVTQNFSEEQLDECELTLKDLHVIAETFLNVLLGIYHQRIEYPDLPEDKNTKITVLKTKQNKVV